MHLQKRQWGLLGLCVLAVGLFGWSLTQGSLAQSGPIRFQLVSENLNSSEDTGGSWAFEEGQVIDASTNLRVGYYQNIYRTFTGTGSGPNAATIRLTILLDDATDTLPPSSIVMMGTHSFDSGNQQGSVVAAGGNVDDQLIGREFEFDAATGVLMIFD